MLFITRRFLKIYLKLEKKKTQTKIYNYFFLILVLVNTLIMITLGVFMILELLGDDPESFADEKGNSYIILSHSIFSFLSSTVLFIMGSHLKSMIHSSLKDSSEKGNMNHYIGDVVRRDSILDPGDFQHLKSDPKHVENKFIENPEILFTSLKSKSSQEDIFESKPKSISENKSKEIDFEDHQEKEIYFSVRIKQINLVTITFLVSDTYQVFYSLAKMIFLHDHFDNQNLKVVPITTEGSLFFFLNNLSILLPILANFLAFYYLIRDSFKVKHERKNSLHNDFSEKDLKPFSTVSRASNRDIEQYLM
jgi:hypothetical protein